MKPGDVYLLAYNAVQFLGWGSILVKTVGGLLAGLAYPQLYANVELELKIFQTAAILEIIHCVFGLVRSPVGTTLTQVFSRVTVLWLILYKVESSRASIGVPMLLMAWSITEVIRYSFYALKLLNAVPGVLGVMRYTFFIGLYPMGAGGELLTMGAALPDYHVVIFLCLIYIPFFSQLYGFFIRLTGPEKIQQEIPLENDKTNEKLVFKAGVSKGKERLLISRYSTEAAKHKIEEDEISEWDFCKGYKRIYLSLE